VKFKKIIFKQARKHVSGLIQKPKSAISYPPKWYKDQKLFSNNENNYFKAFKKSTNHNTYKMCIPLVDSLTAGYMLVSSADSMVVNTDEENYNPLIRWNVDFEIADSQADEVLGNYPVPVGYNKKVFRWYVDWKIITPPGYSLWITHPSHRYDLPFFTMTGFVDTDKHPNFLLLPFFIKENFEGIIEEGTPIAQIIPIKRDNWKSVEENFSEQDIFNYRNNVKINLIRTYKNKYWSKKKYE
jgi:hypothetical protein